MKKFFCYFAIFTCLVMNPAFGEALVLCVESHGEIAVELSHDVHACEHPEEPSNLQAFVIAQDGNVSDEDCGDCVDVMVLAPGEDVTRVSTPDTGNSTMFPVSEPIVVPAERPDGFAAVSVQPSVQPVSALLRTVVLLT